MPNVQAPYRWNVRRLARGSVLDVGCGLAPCPGPRTGSFRFRFLRGPAACSGTTRAAPYTACELKPITGEQRRQGAEPSGKQPRQSALGRRKAKYLLPTYAASTAKHASKAWARYGLMLAYVTASGRATMLMARMGR
jgi:hypothetical protein